MTQIDIAQAEWEHRRRLRKRIERGDNFIDLARETKLAPVEFAHALWLAFKDIDQPSPKELQLMRRRFPPREEEQPKRKRRSRVVAMDRPDLNVLDNSNV